MVKAKEYDDGDVALPDGDAAAIVSAVERYHRPTVLEGEESGAAAVALPEGMRIESIKPFFDEYRDKPERRSGVSHHTRLVSFIDHVNRFKKEAETVLFAIDDRSAPQLIAVYNYHPAGGDEHDARFCDHRAVYRFPVSDEWAAWQGAASGEMSQQGFAEFIEDRRMDLLDPSLAGDSVKEFADAIGVSLATPARLVELSRGLSVHVDQKVATHQNLSSGEGQIQYEESHRDGSGKPLKVPGAFAISIPVFRGGANYMLGVRLRYRVRGGNVVWGVAIQQHEAAFLHALDEACTEARLQTDLPLFYGTP